jgi:hypothetical protein
VDYNGNKYLTNPVNKCQETVASMDELAPFASHATQMAALDYIVSVESDVFVPSYSGHMARAVEGHRRYLGHRKTITPDRYALCFLKWNLLLKDSCFLCNLVDLLSYPDPSAIHLSFAHWNQGAISGVYSLFS